MATSNYIKNVAIFGAGGRSGRPIAESLLATGNHTVTALTRASSTSSLPPGIIKKVVDYSDPTTLVAALRNQDALIITLSVTTHALHPILVAAAAEANVPWILPNEWGLDTANETLVRDIPPLAGNVAQREQIEGLGVSSWIGVSTGFWYEWSLGIAEAFGVDFEKGVVTFFDEGEARISVSTWPQVGRAVARLLSLPVRADDSGEVSLERFRNRLVYVSSFVVAQKDMFESALRVTGTKAEEWKVVHEPSHERYASGLVDFKTGSMLGFGKVLYTRGFFPDRLGDLSAKEINGVLGLEDETARIDEYTAIAIERQKNEPHFWGL
ncbi:NAD(P)-binding protein [Lophiostoma macrostomum CBS 122681]|uniref:NAD(P)-binding protein n=1 Tax=Lophiostoma macrostomum CBS 122681 TaxID=1314788 RepID=A0A6A6TM03_9PLEO|nr:NAD(P)-binding protein [Lophiostoma macrostomum CBS 122681]